MVLLDGKRISEEIIEELKGKVAGLNKDKEIIPGLAAVLVGDIPASSTYVRNKIKACEKTGIRSFLHHCEETITEQDLLRLIDGLNHNKEVHGILVQLPLPSHISQDHIIEAINPRKDVDGFHPENSGKLVKDLPSFVPCTPLGVLTLMEKYNIETQGRHCVIVGRSNIVGRPLSVLLGQKRKTGNATVTLCHTATRDLSYFTRQADILIACSGIPFLIKKEMIKKGVIVIDVGINRISDPNAKSGYRLAGDVDFENVKEICSYITPVPGGVGPMTIAMLLKNTVEAAALYG